MSDSPPDERWVGLPEDDGARRLSYRYCGPGLRRPAVVRVEEHRSRERQPHAIQDVIGIAAPERQEDPLIQLGPPRR